MNKEILRIALPAIVANVTIPLLGMIDLAVAGHLGTAECIGAVAVGSMMLSLVYQNFGFLRMGTSGITAQAYGGRDFRQATLTLLRSSVLALLIGAVILLLQYPLQWLVLLVVGPSEEVLALARQYFFICVWGAPAMLIMMSVKGWFLGMQDSRTPMIISITVDATNAVASIIAVFLLGMGFVGIAYGTLLSAYVGLALSVFLIVRKHGSLFRGIALRQMWESSALGRLFRVNRDIFLRSACLMTVTLSFTAIGARIGDITLAVNAMMIQLFLLISYFMDGFAFAGEALVGRFYGAREYGSLRRCVKLLFGWGMAVMTVFAFVYGTFAPQLFGLLTDNPEVISAGLDYRWWCVAIPLAGMAGFVWDGVFIGLTATRGMLISVVVSCATFFAISFVPVGDFSNNRLWLAFIAYLAMRGAVQTVCYCMRFRKSDSRFST